MKTRVVGIAEDSLDPWQDPCGGHGLVGEVAWGKVDTVGIQSFVNIFEKDIILHRSNVFDVFIHSC